MKLKPARKADAASPLVRLEQNGFRRTPQREHVYQVLASRPDHPTADEVFIRARREMPEISMATVYNTLDALVRCQLVRLVNHGGGAMRYCPNMRPHHHFFCEKCGAAYDIDSGPNFRLPHVPMPKGFEATRYELVFRGSCPHCNQGPQGGRRVGNRPQPTGDL